MLLITNVFVPFSVYPIFQGGVPVRLTDSIAVPNAQIVFVPVSEPVTV